MQKSADGIVGKDEPERARLKAEKLALVHYLRPIPGTRLLYALVRIFPEMYRM